MHHPTGIVPIGAGIFMSSKMDYMAYSSGAIKADLFREASDYSSKQGQTSELLSSKGEDAVMAQRYALGRDPVPVRRARTVGCAGLGLR